MIPNNNSHSYFNWWPGGAWWLSDSPSLVRQINLFFCTKMTWFPAPKRPFFSVPKSTCAESTVIPDSPINHSKVCIRLDNIIPYYLCLYAQEKAITLFVQLIHISLWLSLSEIWNCHTRSIGLCIDGYNINFFMYKLFLYLN